MPKKESRKIVAYHTDLVNSDGCYYDTPGPVLFYYRPKNKRSTIFPESDKGVWVEIHPKYRNSMKISKEEGFCFGGDYGVMKMPRYTVSMVLPGLHAAHKNTRDVYNRIHERAKDMASTLVKRLNKSGYLIVSYGDLQFNSTDRKEIKIQFSLGMVLNVMPTEKVVQSYTQDAFVWKSINTDKHKDPTNEFSL